MKFTINQFITKANNVHNNKYNYSKFIYVNSKTKGIIICPIHGEFEQKPNDHLSGYGCKKCGYYKNGINCRNSKQEFINKANKYHNFKYDYSKFVYETILTPSLIICPIHGEFLQTPKVHVRSGCPKCKTSKGELSIIKWLDSNNIKYNFQCKFDDMILKKSPFDFYLPDYNICIEFDGRQHYEPHSFGTNKSNDYMRMNLKLVQEKDKIKDEYCLNNNIRLIRIPYHKIQEIDNILNLGVLNPNSINL